MWLLTVIGVIILLIIWYFVSQEFYKVAEAKGFPEKKYLWITFFFGALGALLVVALPDRGINTNGMNTTNSNENKKSKPKITSKLVSLIPDSPTTQTDNKNIKEPDFESSSDIEKLEYYKKLFDSGKISEKEFVEMRKMLIGQ